MSGLPEPGPADAGHEPEPEHGRYVVLNGERAPIVEVTHHEEPGEDGGPPRKVTVLHVRPEECEPIRPIDLAAIASDVFLKEQRWVGRPNPRLARPRRSWQPASNLLDAGQRKARARRLARARGHKHATP